MSLRFAFETQAEKSKGYFNNFGQPWVFLALEKEDLLFKKEGLPSEALAKEG